MIRRLGWLLPLLFSAVDAHARAGGGGGFHGGGGHFGGGYSGGSHYSGGGGGSGGGFGFIVYYYLQFVIEHPFIGLPLTAFLFWIFYVIQNQSGGVAAPSLDSPSFPSSRGLDSQLQTSRREALALIQRRDAAFDEAAFLRRAAGAFLVVQTAWSEQDMSKARAFVSDGVFERFSRQIAEQKARGTRNRMTDVLVTEIEALGYLAGLHYDTVYVRVRASAVDETIASDDGRVLEGGPDEFEEVWTFLRRPGVKTRGGAGLLEGSCPSCGAPLAIADAAQCAACKAWVNSGEHDWVLVMITQASEWAFPSPEREVTGWEILREEDPGLSLESIEDRASLVFWRWLDARRRQDPAPLRGVAADEFLAALAFDGLFERDAAVGAVSTMAFESGADFDRAHIQVRWEAEQIESPGGGAEVSRGRDRRTHFLVFKRRSGATSDVKAGLRTARCPSCGAPPAEADAASCSYCSRAFNDGRLSWVLAEIVPFGMWRRPSTGPAAPVALYGLDWGENLAPVDAVAVLAKGLAADGVVDDREKAFLFGYAEKRGVSAEKAAELVAAALRGGLDLPRPADNAQAESMLRGLIRMVLADGVVNDSERALLAAFAGSIGLDGRDVGQLIKEERLALQVQAAAAQAARRGGS